MTNQPVTERWAGGDRWPARLLRLARPLTQSECHTGGDVFVFTGGAARGAAQVGMLAELVESGIRPDAVVGCSVGSLNATWFACYPNLEGVTNLDVLWRSLTAEDIFPISRIRVLAGLTHRDHIVPDDGLRRLMGLLPIDDLTETAIPVRVVTTRLDTGELAVHASGHPGTVLAASCALPGVFAPVVIDGAAHIDGGVIAVAPVDAAREFSPKRIFLLDVAGIASTDQIRTALDVVRVSLMHATRTQLLAARSTPDVITITLPEDITDGVEARDFSHTPRLIEAGRAAARTVLDTLDTSPTRSGRRRPERARARP